MQRLPVFVIPEHWVSGDAFGSGGVDDARGRPIFGSAAGDELRAEGEGEAGVEDSTGYRCRGTSGAEWARGGSSGSGRFKACCMVRDTAGWGIVIAGGRGKGWNPPTNECVVA